MPSDRELLDEQIAYYRARAPEYDEWFNRTGRYDRGAEQRARWFREIGIAETALRSMGPLGDVLELACGTGLWTRHLAAISRRVLAVDAAPEAIAINRDRLRADNVAYVVSDIFTPSVATRVDVVFFSFWLSHVPPDRFDSFWRTVRSSLRPSGRVFFLDSLRDPSSAAVDHERVAGSSVARRRLNDGREYRVVKVFYEPLDLERRLCALGWRGTVRSTDHYFFWGSMEPSE